MMGVFFNMKFRKSVKVCKGVRVNISKSGVSTTVGRKGASVNIGKKGTYLNYGLPGTGIYDRKKISGSNNKSNGSYNKNLNFYSDYEDFFDNFDLNHLHIDYKDDGSMYFYLKGIHITDSSIIRKIKRENDFKIMLNRLNQERIELYEKINNEYLDIQKGAIKVPRDIEELLKINEPKNESFNEYIIPDNEEFIIEAKKSISIFKFWKRKQLIQDYVNDKQAYHQQKKQQHDEIESKRINDINNERKSKYENFKCDIEAISQGNTDTLDSMIQEWIASLDFTFEFNIKYKVLNNKLYVDLYLPKFEDFPHKKTQLLKSGIVKVKDKSQKEQRLEYAKYVYGMAIFFTSYLFRFAIHIDEIIMSEYTKRRNKQGILQDDCILSVKFIREQFIKLDYTTDPKDNVLYFENSCLQLKNNDFKVTVPFSEKL